MRSLLLTAVLAFGAVGCAGNFGTPDVRPGMDPEEAHRRCVGSFPPALPVAIRMRSDGTFRKVYRQTWNGVSTYIVVDDKDGQVTDVRVTSF